MHRPLSWIIVLVVIFATAPLLAQQAAEKKTEKKKEPAPAKAPVDAGAKWEPLFNGKNLDNWKKTSFGGEGEVSVEAGSLVIEMGSPMSGVTWKAKDPPHKTSYEIRLEAKRVKGSDFFVALTFPVEESHCSFIAGGWGGGVVGLSSINSLDASENSTTSYQEFKNDQWYKFRVKVTKEKIQCWIDEKQVVDQELKDRKISTRIEVDENKPLGLATYDTKAAIKNFEIRPVK